MRLGDLDQLARWLEMVLSKADEVVISCNRYPVELVKSKMLKLNASHIEYVLDCMRANTSKVKNIKKYLLAALFNATTTMGRCALPTAFPIRSPIPEYCRT